MRIVLLGALGEVGRSLRTELVARGHDVIAVTGRPDAASADVAWIGELASLPSPDAVVNASGPGDHRRRSGWHESTAAAAAVVRELDVPAVLLSTIRVMEGATADFDEDAHAVPTTPYGKANAEHERSWLDQAGGGARVLRLANILAVPGDADSPQSRLLPWSLAVEALHAGTVTVRSGPGLRKGFIDAADIAAAVELVVAGPAPVRCATAPAAELSLRELVEAVQAGLADAGLAVPTASFGPDGPSAPRCRPGWLASQGWQARLTPGAVRALVASWAAQRASMPS